MFGHEEIKKMVAFQEQIRAEIGKEKFEVELFEISPEVDKLVRDMSEKDLLQAIVFMTNKNVVMLLKQLTNVF